MKAFLCGLAVLATLACVPRPGLAQDRDATLADIRQELSVLYVELRRLRRELSTTGGTGELVTGGSVLDRLSAIEGELQRLTAQTEELELRIEGVVRDGTNRIGDLEFRLCELEPDCDIATLGETPTLGGAGASDPVPGAAPADDAANGDGAAEPELAVGEKEDFENAEAALEDGEYAAAADLLRGFRETYPGSPLAGRAGLLLGRALEGAGDTSGAARAFLNTFSAAPADPAAPQALYRLGAALGRLGKVDEACVTLGEVGPRYPQAADVVEAARDEMRELGCP